MATPTTQDASPDGTPTQNALLFQGRQAVVASTWKAFASLANNQTFIVPENSSGTPTLVTFEAKLADYARGTLTCVAKANLVNNETFTLNDGVNAATVFEFQVNGSFTPAGGGVVVIDIQAATTAIEVAALVHAAINAVGAGLAITSTNSGTATLALVNDAYGAYNTAISDTVTDAGFTHTGMSGGAAWTATGGAVVVVDCAGDTTRPEVLADFRDFLNARPNVAYVWAINGTNDGLVGTAKNYGDPWNIAPYGSTLTAYGITTEGLDAIASSDTRTPVAAYVYDETLISVGASVPGDVVRRVSAGVWTPASADTAANCAGNLGVYTGAAVVPIVGNIPRLNFTGTAPTLGVPCYLSATSGKATSTVPSPLAIPIPLGVPYIDLTVSTDYAAKVGQQVINAIAPSLELQLLAKVAQDCGGSPADYDWFYDGLNLKSSSTQAPFFGDYTGGTPVFNANYFALHSTAGSGFAFAQSVPWFQANPGANRGLVAVRMSVTHKGEWLFWMPGAPALGIGCWDNDGGGSAVNPDNFSIIHNVTPTWHTVPTAGQVIDTGIPFDTNQHWFAIEMMGDGTRRVSIDWGAWTTISDPAGAGGFSVAWAHFFNPDGVAETFKIDDVFYAVKRF